MTEREKMLAEEKIMDYSTFYVNYGNPCNIIRANNKYSENEPCM